MNQTSGSPRLVRRILVVDAGLAGSANATVRSVRALEAELQSRNIEVVEATSCEDGLATVTSDTGIHCLLLNWTQDGNDKGAHAEATQLLRAVRKRNAKLPIFLMAGRDLTGSISVEVATLADEFIWIREDTASFISGRIQASIEHYLANLLPPYAAALARYDRESEYSWAAPGHQGGVAFLKSPVGRVFFDFFGENLFRTDMGIERGALGSLLGHSGPVGESERLCGARLRRASLLHRDQRHVRVEPRHHVRLRRRRRDRVVRPQLPQVDRAGPGEHRRHPGLPDADTQSLRHHRPDSAGAARAEGDRARASPPIRSPGRAGTSVPSTRS